MKIKHVKELALIGMLSASLTSLKLAFMVIPNVEVVTLLIVVYTAVFGLRISLPVTIVFVSVEMLLFGVYYWVIAYYLHWCGLAVACAITKCVFKKSTLPMIIVAVFLTALFGVTTSLIDTFVVIGSTDVGFFKVFSIIYMRGIYFYITHAVSNIIILSFLFKPLEITLNKLKPVYFGREI